MVDYYGIGGMAWYGIMLWENLVLLTWEQLENPCKELCEWLVAKPHYRTLSLHNGQEKFLF